MNKKKPKKRGSRPPARKAGSRPKTRLWITKGRKGSKAGPQVQDHGIWIYNPANGDISNPDNTPWKSLIDPDTGLVAPYQLEEGDVITCFDPNDPANPDPSIDSFEVQASDNETDPPDEDDPIVIDYNCSDTQDILEVDWAVLDGFTENYNPETGGAGSEECPYTVEDETGSIGING